MSRLYQDSAVGTSYNYNSQDDYRQYDSHYLHASPSSSSRAQNYSYNSEGSQSPPDDHPTAYPPETDATYPPMRSQPPNWSIPSPKLSTARYGLRADPVESIKTFGSSVDLETLHTDDMPERPIHSLTEVRASEVETGWRAALWPRSKPCRAYILTVLAETIVDVAVEGAVLQQLDKLQDTVPNQKKSSLATNQTRQPIYLGIFVLAHFLQSALAIDAVYNKNTLQFLFLACFNFTLLMYGIMQIVEVNGNIGTFVGAGATSPSIPVHALINIVPCVIAVAEVAYIGLGYQIWKEFGWKVYKFLGADRNIRKIYGQYQIFQCLLKFDIFFWVGFSVQWMVLIPLESFEFYATIAALPLAILLLVEGYLAARHENRWMMGSFMIGCVLGCAYFTYKAWRIFENKHTDTYVHVWKSLLIFACISIVLLVLTFVSATIVMLNFDRGLKENMNKKAKQHRLERRATHYKGSGPPPPDLSINVKRMSIE